MSGIVGSRGVWHMDERHDGRLWDWASVFDLTVAWYWISSHVKWCLLRSFCELALSLLIDNRNQYSLHDHME